MIGVASDLTLAELATTVPGAARVLERHRLDYCRRGKQTLREACAARTVAPEDVLHGIEAIEHPGADGTVGWETAPLRDLVAHIVRRYHEPLRFGLLRLLALAQKVERVHASKPNVPRGLADHLAIMGGAVDVHLAKEELILFPMIAEGGGATARMPIRMTLEEHDDHAAALERTRLLTQDLVVPADACASWRALYLGLAELEANLHEQIALENHVLFSRALRG
jgi:regulator of cell morphogenesis and NO signaling